MNDGILFVVPSDRHVERVARDGVGAETLRAFRQRLTTDLLPSVSFAEAAETRLVLAMALSDPEFRAAGQLALFEAATVNAGPAPTTGGGILGHARARGGASWTRLVTAVDDAIGRLRAAGGTAEHLRRATGGAVTVTRATMLADAMESLDRRLADGGTVDVRLVGRRLADAISAAPVARLVELVGYQRVRSRWNIDWVRDDLGWWRALDEKLARVGGWARIALPRFDRPLQGRKEADPLDETAEDVADALDDAPEAETIAPVLGYLTTVPANVDPTRVSVVRTADATGQAREAVRAIGAALGRGAALDRIAVALPVLDEHALAPLRRALEAAAIPFFEQGAETHSTSPVVAAALLALDTAANLDRVMVARLLRSGYLDATKFVLDAPPRVARRTLTRAAGRLESRATAAGTGAVERIVRTVAADMPVEGAALQAIGEILEKAGRAATRGERITAARQLWTELGISEQAGRGGLAAFGTDERPNGVLRAERAAVARDARAWEALAAAIELTDDVTTRMGARDQPIDADAFRAELLSILDSQTRRPAAGRGAAVRIGRIGSFVGEEIDSLTILDCVDGRLPANDALDRLLTQHLSAAISKASRGAFRPPKEGAARARSLTSLAGAAAECHSIQLVYTTEDATGAPQEPSFVVDTVVRGGVHVFGESAEAAAVSSPTAASRAGRERRREAFFLDPARPRSDVVGDLEPRPVIHDLLTKETGGGALPLAVTSLERFARCAFRGTAEVVFGARDPERRQELPDAREEGTIVHEVLAAAFTAVKAQWAVRPRPTADILAKAFAAADAVLDGWQGHAALRAIVRLRIREGVRAVLLAAIADEVWDFTEAEQPFGAGSQRATAAGAAAAPATPWPAPELVRGEEHLRLRGTIDRVDRAHDGAAVRVIDYKRSISTVKESMRSLGETALQIPIYAGVAARVNEVPSDGLYMATQARDLATGELSSPKNRERLAALLEPGADGLSAADARALDLVTTIRSGHLLPLPASEGECRTCSVSGGCRKPRFAMVAAEDGEDSV